MKAVIPAVVILLMVALTALYVAAEFATVGSRRSRVQEAAESGNPAAGALLEILRDPRRLDNYVAACQIGITLTNLVAGAYGQAQLTPLLTPLLGPVGGQVLAVFTVLVIITVLMMVLGELLPKTVALRYPERLAMATLRPMQLSLSLFRPLIALFNGTAFALMRAWKLDTDHSHAHVHSPEELQGLYRESAAGGLIDVGERDMLSGVLNVNDRVVREIMTPRTRLVTVSAEQSVRQALPRLAESAYSRFPVMGTDVMSADVMGTNQEAVLGIADLRTLFQAAELTPNLLVAELVRSPLIVTEIMPVPQLWRRLREARRHSAVVVNEYGSLVGLVTLEDALEEIFGELQDEFDDEDEPLSVLGEQVTVRGDVLIEVLNDRFGLRLPTDEVDTVGGLIWQLLGRLPLVGDEVSVEDAARSGAGRLVLRVELMERRAVQRVGFILPGGER